MRTQHTVVTLFPRYHRLHDHEFLPHSDSQFPLPIVVRTNHTDTAQHPNTDRHPHTHTHPPQADLNGDGSSEIIVAGHDAQVQVSKALTTCPTTHTYEQSPGENTYVIALHHPTTTTTTPPTGPRPPSWHETRCRICPRPIGGSHLSRPPPRNTTGGLGRHYHCSGAHRPAPTGAGARPTQASAGGGDG